MPTERCLVKFSERATVLVGTYDTKFTARMIF